MEMSFFFFYTCQADRISLKFKILYIQVNFCLFFGSIYQKEDSFSQNERDFWLPLLAAFRQHD